MVAAPALADQAGEHQGHAEHEHGDEAEGHGDEGRLHAGHWMAPPEAQERQNPVPVTPENLAEAAEVYAESCSICHGPEGKGDGDAAAGLDPKPADLRQMVPIHSDGDLAWKIEHGRGTMPAWGEILDERTIWQLVNYLREGIGAETAGGHELSQEHEGPSTEGATPDLVPDEQAKVILSHEPIAALGWPAMTKDLTLLAGADTHGVAPGEQVEFELARVPDGVYGVSAIWPAGEAPPAGQGAIRGRGTLNAIAGEQEAH